MEKFSIAGTAAKIPEGFAAVLFCAGTKDGNNPVSGDPGQDFLFLSSCFHLKKRKNEVL